MRLVLGWLLGLLVWPALATPPDFPTTWQVGETTLQRNGLGVREYGFFNIDGYAAALYLTQRSSDAEAILNSSTAKAVHMRFLRGGGDADDARRVWRDAIEANCPEPACTLDEQALGEFLAAVPAARKGNTETMEFGDDLMRYRVNGSVVATVRDATLRRVLLATWIGDAPPTAKLKRALLGAGQ